MNMKKYAIYLRVSTKMQGASGLGLDAQRNTCTNYIETQKGTILQEFIDIESGTNRNRKGLFDAINFCKANGCTLVIAKLDRLARDVEFTFKVINTGIDIHFCDMPSLNTMILGVFASVSQYERELIVSRTKSALSIKKAKGCKLGRASKNYTNNVENQLLGIAKRAKSKNLSVIESRDFDIFCTILSHNFEAFKCDTNKPYFWLNWNRNMVTLTKDKKERILQEMREYKKIDNDLFMKINGISNIQAMDYITNKFNSTFNTIKNYKLNN